MLLSRQCNYSQEDAIICAYQNEEICTVQGPPGTGKTSTLVYCLLEELYSDKRVLACAPSNNAADNIAERFLKLGYPEEKVLRIAHPTRVREEIHHLLLDKRVENSDEVVNKVEEIKLLIHRLPNATVVQKKELYHRLSYLYDELEVLKELKSKQVLKEARVVVTTIASSANKMVQLY